MPSIRRPSTIFGPVQPLGEARTIIGQRGRADLLLTRASRWMARICSTAVSSAAAMAHASARLVSLDKIRCPSVAAEELFQFIAGDAGEDGGVGNLVPVEMEDRKYRSVGRRIEKFVGMPRRGKWSGFRLAIADDARDHETRIVEGRAERMAERIAELAAFVDRARALGRYVTGNASGNENCLKSFLRPASSWLISG